MRKNVLSTEYSYRAPQTPVRSFSHFLVGFRLDIEAFVVRSYDLVTKIASGYPIIRKDGLNVVLDSGLMDTYE